MLKNYLKIAWRNLIKNSSSSLINIGGMAIGMAVAITIGLWIWDELSFNKSFKNYNSIAQVYSTGSLEGKWKTSESTPRPLEAELRTKYGSSFKHIVMSQWTSSHLLSAGERKITERGRFMQPAAPDMLSLEMIRGNRSALNDPSTIIVTESAAKALFGNADPMNKMIRIDNEMNVKVGGVYKNLPDNTEFGSLNFIAPWDLLTASERWIEKDKDEWNNDDNFCLMYVQIAPNTTFEVVSERIKSSLQDNVNAESKRFNFRVFLHPMSRWHLYSEWKNGVNTGGAIQFVWLFGIIGTFVLLLACINFMNLSTARSEKRAKEVGIRKTIGSGRRHLIKQFLSESFLVAIISFAVAVLIVSLALTWFNQIADKQVSIPWKNPYFSLFSGIFIVITSLLAGSYPAFYLSAFNPIRALKGKFIHSRLTALPRKVLVVVQFTVSVTLIIGTFIVYRQIQYAKNRPLGYHSNGLVGIRMKYNDMRWQANRLGGKLKDAGIAKEFSLSNSPVTEVWQHQAYFEWKGKTGAQVQGLATFWVSHDFGKTLGWTIKEGRDFSRQFATDSTTDESRAEQVHSIILNEAATEYMAMKKAVGEIIRWHGNPFRVIGVVKNQLMDSPFESVQPTVYLVNYDQATSWMYIKLNPALNASEAISRLEATFKSLLPSVPFEYSFVDEDFAEKFGAEERIGKLAGVFASLAVFISCLGLLGLSSFVAEQRSKEISIRKVLGATVLNLWSLLSLEFLLLVTFSCFIAFPIAWHFLSGWLQSYEYRTEISWWIFVLAGGCAILIALITVSFQGIKTAIANPVKNLRSE